jgi:DNA-binding winged helix-turn-helix (wHTH) protein/tetratricopeptide (TPR) repeat protein
MAAMIFSFGAFQLDTATAELRCHGAAVPVEPQVLSLLRLLIEHRERLVSKGELIERIWGGRSVSDAAVASRIKSARQAVGDSGDAQLLIRTMPKLGFRFVGDVTVTQQQSPYLPNDAPPPVPDTQRNESARPSIAVRKFDLLGEAGDLASMAEALPHDLIVELSRMRWLFVIARGSSFQVPPGEAASGTVRSLLNAHYCLSGAIEIGNRRMSVKVELCDTRDNGVVWAEHYNGSIDAVHDIRARIAHAVVNALELQIPLNEARRVLNAPHNLDAWSAYHLGLHQMYKFDREANRRAATYFEQAIAREPGFARAYAGLSFAYFEEAFLHFTHDTRAAAAQARHYAELGLEQDPLDPFCNLVMGRALWLTADLDTSLAWLDRAVALNPNYAQGKYSCAWTRTMLGEGSEGQSLVDAARALSPLDPLLYGMLGVRAFSHIVLDQPAEAALWAERAARAPRAHALIELNAAVAHAMNGDPARAAGWAQSARIRQPGLQANDFLRAFPFRDPAVRRRVQRALDGLRL